MRGGVLEPADSRRLVDEDLVHQRNVDRRDRDVVFAVGDADDERNPFRPSECAVGRYQFGLRGTITALTPQLPARSDRRNGRRAEATAPAGPWSSRDVQAWPAPACARSSRAAVTHPTSTRDTGPGSSALPRNPQDPAGLCVAARCGRTESASPWSGELHDFFPVNRSRCRSRRHCRTSRAAARIRSQARGSRRTGHGSSRDVARAATARPARSRRSDKR